MRNKIPCSAERLSLLDPSMIQAVVDRNAFHIGNQYLSENRVRIVEADDSQISSAVIGNSGLYEQTIRLKEGHLISKCSCALPEEPMCRHCIAVLLEYHRWAQPRHGQQKKAQPSTSPQPTQISPSRDSAPAPSLASTTDLKLGEVMAFVEWLQPAIKALERGQSLPDSPKLGGDLASCSVRRRLAGRRVADRSREIGEADLSLSVEHREPLDEVLQLADVARPGMPPERVDRLLRKRQRPLLARVVAREKMRRQQRHVAAALA